MVLILKCNCKNEFQDNEHGPQMRVFNTSLKSSATCTVCGYVAKLDPTAKKK